MIIRLWHGRTAKSDYEAYTEFMRQRAAPDYRSVDGNHACYFLRRLDDLVKDGEISANVEMQPGDILIIPESFF